MTIISLLDLPLDLPSHVVESRGFPIRRFTDGLPDYLSRCKAYHGSMVRYLADRLCASGQTFEGGISGSPGVEAHGAYAFCALSCLSIIGPPEEMIPRYKAIPAWMFTRALRANYGLGTWISPCSCHGYLLDRTPPRAASPDARISWSMVAIAIGSVDAGHCCSLPWMGSHRLTGRLHTL